MRRFLDPETELTQLGRKITCCLVLAYALVISYMCFGPQHVVNGVETPNIQYFGRVVILLVPFNSFVSFSQLDTPLELVWVIGQNIANIFLLYPLLLGMLMLIPSLRTWKRILLIALGMSLAIELTQVILDILIDANRVFEIDDLWTNTLGGALALASYKWLIKTVKNKNEMEI